MTYSELEKLQSFRSNITDGMGDVDSRVDIGGLVDVDDLVVDVQ